jgi:FkbM family methyltransferase
MLGNNDRAHALIEMALSPAGLRALRYQRPLSLSAFALVNRLARLGFNPATLIDVGANRGQFLAAALFQWPGLTVHAFEPLPHEGAALEARFREIANVTVHKSALGNEEGIASLHCHISSLSSSLLRSTSSAQERFDWAEESETTDVPVHRLDAVISPDQLRSPALLKIDVQGFESHVLSGADGLLHDFEAILVEHSFEPFYQGQPNFPDAISELVASGWVLARVLSTRSEEGIPVEADCLYLPEDSEILTLM